LPDHLASTVTKRMRAAYHADSALAAEAQLEALAKELDRTHPGAAASLREGLAETLTVLRLGVPPTLARTLRSTNSIESMISICRTHAANVKNWQNDKHGAALVRSRNGRSGPSSSAASTVTCTCPHCVPRSTSMSPHKLSVPSVMMKP
jgi:transposase-like protein